MAKNLLPFEAIAAAALTRADGLVSQWLPEGKREGHEWKALNPMRADGRVGSFSINLSTGAWGDFASDDKGGDLVSLYAYLFTGGDQGKAAREVASLVGIEIPPATAPRDRKAERQDEGGAQASSPTDEAPAPKEKKKRSPWIPVLPVPDDAPEPPKAHEFRGLPTHAWRYLNADGKLLGIVCRFTTSDGDKEITPLHFCRHESTGKTKWNWISAPEPRPLYGLDRLAAKTGATVLVPEGEKCADVGHEHLPEMASVTWSGGSKAWDKTDWSPLAGRKVVLWPDCDAQRDKKTQELLSDEKQPGWRAMAGIAQRLLALGCQVWMLQIPPPGAKPSGWDIADAIAEGFVGTALNDYVTNNLVRIEPEPEADTRAAERHPNAPKAPAEGKEYIPDLIWKKDGLAGCLSNVYQIMKHSKAWAGVIAFDEFSQRTVKLKPPPYPGGTIGEWDSTDDSRTAITLSKQWQFSPSSATVAEAVETLGHDNAVHPVRAFLESLPPWDETVRLTEWLTDCLGVKKTEYSMRVGTWYLTAMINRVMRPGCKFDYCLVLEGPQGRGKSTALKILGGDWYADTDLDLHNKDSMSALRGKWLYEFPELGSVTRVEERKQKSFLSRDVDEYRPVYGRREIKSPRQLVFAGTTNEWEWNKDPTGGRRFWPVECGEINHEALIGMREQLFAEALHRFRRGKRFWPTPEEQAQLFDPEQLKVEMPDSIVDAIHDWVFEQPARFSMAKALSDGLHITDVSKHTRDIQIRVGTALRKLGCKKVEQKNGMVRFWYEPPERKGAWSKPTSPAQQEEEYVGF